MATQFPADLDLLVNPQPNDSVEVVSHADQHANANDAIEALEVKVGKDNDTNPNSLDFKVRTLETNFLDVDEVEDLAAGLLTSGTHGNITVSYDDTNRKINLTATYDNEEVISAVANALTAGNGITKTYNQTPAGYVNEYDNGYDYQPGDICSTGNGTEF